jgi:hypothetical protein
VRDVNAVESIKLIRRVIGQIKLDENGGTAIKQHPEYRFAHPDYAWPQKSSVIGAVLPPQ